MRIFDILKNTTKKIKSMKARVDGIDALISDLTMQIYPVGSLYMSVNNTNPSTIFGGTWVQIKDTFLLAAGDTYVAGATGGEATHTLSSTEMPAHTHTQASCTNPGNHKHSVGNGQGGSTTLDAWTAGSEYDDNFRNQNNYARGGYYTLGTMGAGSHTHTITLNNTGGGGAHNNMPPYLTVYVWKRTA